MLPQWLRFALLGMSLYGLWGFWGAKAARLIDAKSVMFFSSLGTLVAGGLCLFLLHFKPELTSKGVTFSVLTGLSTGLGTIFFIAALRQGQVVPVVMITALYPLITLLLAVLFLHEQLSLVQWTGVVFFVNCNLLFFTIAYLSS